jgi:hypothetical protein
MLMVACYGLGRHLSRGLLTVPSLEGALVAWLALFLTCTYLQVSQLSRERTTLIHEEADSIAQVYRIMQTLPRGQRAQMRLLLISYLDAKLRGSLSAAQQGQEIRGFQHQLYSLSCDLTEQKALTPIQGQTLGQALNAMISLHYRCDYAQRDRLPGPVVALLLIHCAGVSLVLGLGSRHAVLTGVCLVMMVFSLFVIFDLDDGNAGFMRVDRSNLKDLVNILHQQEEL